MDFAGEFTDGRLSARPGSHLSWMEQVRSAPTPSGDLQTLWTPTGDRAGLLYVPTNHKEAIPAPLVVALHGAGGNAQHGIGLWKEFGDATGFLILAPKSRQATWDMLSDGFGPDVTNLDRMLETVFAHYAVDPARLAISGYSDGASYALSLGVTNGDLFSHVIAFSPGFMVSPQKRGQPPIFVSHGTADRVLPIDRCSRQIVPRLLRAGYPVEYQEFKGGHEIPSAIVRMASEWFLDTGSTDAPNNRGPGTVTRSRPSSS